MRSPDQPRRPTFLELFFDLVFVFAFARVSQQLSASLNGRPFLATSGALLLMLLALLNVWFVITWVTNLYNTRSVLVQLAVVVAMLGSMLMALAIPSALSGTGLTFAGAYLAIHFFRYATFVPALRGHRSQGRAAAALVWFVVSAVPWILGATLVKDDPRTLVWAVAIAIDVIGVARLYPTPWFRGALARQQAPVVTEYLSERFQQFFVVALGELILIAGLTYGGRYFAVGGGHTAAFVVSFATTVLLWRVYTYRSGVSLPAALAAAEDQLARVERALAAHLLMVVGIVLTAAGFELVIDHPHGHTHPTWLTVVFGGPVLFLVGRAALEHIVFSRVSLDRVVGVLAFAALVPLMLVVPPLAVAATATAILGGIAIADTVRGVRHPDEVPSPPARA